jgi:hypothetical protein
MRSQLAFIYVGMFLFSVLVQGATPSRKDLKLYRELALKVRTHGTFRTPMPSRGDLPFSYEFKGGKAMWDQPLINDVYLNPNEDRFVRDFWDKILLDDGSSIELNGDKVPLTCIFVQGHDNRYSQKNTPLLPDLFLKVYLVANDFTCTGPVNPGWPGNGLPKEAWDTYLYFEVRDPTIMLPTNTRVRYRWAEFPAYLVDAGGN